MTEPTFDKRDIEFVLFEQCGLDEILTYDKYAESYDEDTLKIIINEAHKFAVNRLGPVNAQCDEEGLRLADGTVYLPEAYESIYKEFSEGGWVSMARSMDWGGMGTPHPIALGAMEMFVGANPSFMFTPGLTDGAGHLVEAFGSEEQKATYLYNMYTGKWSGTMCLTEPQAGSSVGDATTRAEAVEGEDYYKIVGNKIFISSGDHQLTENIIHLVLARRVGDPEGIKGISLFIVPKHRVDADGNILESNDVTLSGIEHKMGIHASATCALSFGDNDDCHGYLVGEPCKGIVYMFQMMNEARLATGLQGVAIGNTAYQMALNYARERKQGPKVTDRSPDAQSVAIIEHPDVRRNLLTMKAYGEAIRALLYSLAARADRAHSDPDEAVRTKNQDILDLLVPVAKAFPTDMGYKMAELAIQVHGGYGYIKEYGVEQCARDVKIASLYEGTNGIQALDLLGRKMRLKHGGLFLTWLQEINGQIEGWADHAVFGDLSKQLDGAKNALAEAAFGFTTMGKKDPEYPLLHATPFLRMFGLVESARLLMEQADISYNKLQAIWADKGVSEDDAEARAELISVNEDARFYENKIKTASFFVYQLLPETRALLKSVQSGDRSALEIAF